MRRRQISRAASDIGLEVRAGVHTGEIELEGDNVRGVGVHIAARIASLAGPGEVYASWATRELLAGSDVGFTDRGLQELKGLSEPRRVYLVARDHPPDPRPGRSVPPRAGARSLPGARSASRYVG